MKLSILIPSYNMISKAKKCLDSIFSSEADEADYEVVVYDSSDDGSELILAQYVKEHLNLKVIRSKVKTPIGIARNFAFRKSEGEYVYCMDIDDWLYDSKSLKALVELLDGKDVYYCPFKQLAQDKTVDVQARSVEDIVNGPIGVWCKVFKRDKWTDFPYYMPEDVCWHFKMLDKCLSVGNISHVVYVYDNSKHNVGAISRTFDYLLANPSNLLKLASDNTLDKLGLRDEYLSGVIHNLADMYMLRKTLKSIPVREAHARKLFREFLNFMTGIYVH